jgi:hypothetical protein
MIREVRSYLGSCKYVVVAHCCTYNLKLLLLTFGVVIASAKFFKAFVKKDSGGAELGLF